ncbi:acyl-CoA N-acyltransferase [Jimgerdemannia flammicorona]|uniref:Acyl-CoA N-acyltransferase n=1 Tax=Jimgerdemannia flammicorona TaxID=994334 RepID=A0A433QHC1_9FUNG|nr:acyl-CoA N-acyltransferase [Jimgerdemannia flammicorona]
MENARRPQLPPLKYRATQATDLARLHELEKASYPATEAATFAQIEYRLSHVPGELFLACLMEQEDFVCTDNMCTMLTVDKLVAFVNATLSASSTLTAESMKTHDLAGRTVCVHSVVVDPEFRRKGIATKCLTAYVEGLKEVNERDGKKYDRVALLSHQELVPLYEKAGFVLRGKSEVVHGPEEWLELVLEL